MKKIKKIKRSNLPTALPLWSTLTAWLVLDKVDAPGWIWGVVGTLFVIIWIASIAVIATSTEVNLFKED